MKDRDQSSGETSMGYMMSFALAIRFGCVHRIPGNGGSGMPPAHLHIHESYNFPSMFVVISDPAFLLVLVLLSSQFDNCRMWQWLFCFAQDKGEPCSPEIPTYVLSLGWNFLCWLSSYLRILPRSLKFCFVLFYLLSLWLIHLFIIINNPTVSC